MKYLVIIVLFLNSCATTTYEKKSFEGSLSESREKFQDSPRFGFIAHGKKYDFGIGAISDDCEYILGYEDGTLKFKVPFEFSDKLSETFKKSVDLETKSKLILEQIAKLSSQNLSCTHKINTSKELLKNMDPVSAAISVVFWSPVFVLAVLMMPLGIDHIVDGIVFKPKIEKIKLGMSADDVKSIFGDEPVIYQDKKLIAYKYQNKAINLLFLFENSILVGYVHGIQAEYDYLNNGDESIIRPYLKHMK